MLNSNGVSRTRKWNEFNMWSRFTITLPVELLPFGWLGNENSANNKWMTYLNWVVGSLASDIWLSCSRMPFCRGLTVISAPHELTVEQHWRATPVLVGRRCVRWWWMWIGRLPWNVWTWTRVAPLRKLSARPRCCRRCAALFRQKEIPATKRK